MKITIFGGAGFIASHLYLFYVKKYPEAKFSMPGREHCQSFLDVKLILERDQPDIIINCAAEIYRPEKMWVSNVVLVQAILDWMVSLSTSPRPPRFIQIGSSLEYGYLNRPASEYDPASPVDLYSGTKAAATMLCQGHARQYKELRLAIARPFSVYGPFEKDHRLFPTLYRAFYNNEPMTLYEGKHDFIYVDDFVDGINILVDALDDPEISGNIVNFGTGVSTSNFELLEIFKNVTGIKNPPIEINKKFMRKFETDRIWVNDPWVSNFVFNFQPKYDLVSGVKEYVNIMHNRMKNGSN